MPSSLQMKLFFSYRRQKLNNFVKVLYSTEVQNTNVKKKPKILLPQALIEKRERLPQEVLQATAHGHKAHLDELSATKGTTHRDVQGCVVLNGRRHLNVVASPDKKYTWFRKKSSPSLKNIDITVDERKTTCYSIGT